MLLAENTVTGLTLANIKAFYFKISQTGDVKVKASYQLLVYVSAHMPLLVTSY